MGFHKKLLAGTNRITIDSSCRNLATSSALSRFIDAHDHWIVSCNKQANQQYQQQATQFSRRPGGAIEHASDAFWNCFSSEHPITLKMAATVRSPGARIAPIKSTLAHSHTRELQTSSKWRNTCIILLGRVSFSSFSFVRILREADSAFRFLSTDWIKSILDSVKISVNPLTVCSFSQQFVSMAPFEKVFRAKIGTIALLSGERVTIQNPFRDSSAPQAAKGPE